MGRRKWIGIFERVGSFRLPGRLLRECRWLNIGSRGETQELKIQPVEEEMVVGMGWKWKRRE
jgi:hypothetical protein